MIDILDSQGGVVSVAEPTINEGPSGCAIRFIAGVPRESGYVISLDAPAEMEEAVGIVGFEGPEMTFDSLAGSSFSVNFALATSFEAVFSPDESVATADEVAQQSLARSLLAAKTFYSRRDTFDGLTAEHLSMIDPLHSYVDGSGDTSVAPGEVVVRDAAGGQLLLVAMTPQGNHWCIASLDSGITKGRQNAESAEGCVGGW